MFERYLLKTVLFRAKTGVVYLTVFVSKIRSRLNICPPLCDLLIPLAPWHRYQIEETNILSIPIFVCIAPRQ